MDFKTPKIKHVGRHGKGAKGMYLIFYVIGILVGLSAKPVYRFLIED